MVFSFLLSVFSLWVDSVISAELIQKYKLLFIADSAGARSTLSVISSSMVTIAGVTFSITVVALTLASTQFGPRVLRSFMRDRGNQFVLGVFISTFLYSTLILRSVSGVDQYVFVPHLSVNIAILLSIFALFVFIYFIHHVSSVIQADHIISSIADDLNSSIANLYPEDLESEKVITETLEDADWHSGLSHQKSKDIASTDSGYIQLINSEKLFEIASQNGLFIRLLVQPGDFVNQQTPLLTIYSESVVDEQVSKDVLSAIIVGGFRTHVQDVRFGFLQLTEIAIRSLSPGINDPYTAVSVLNRLDGALKQLSGKKFPEDLLKNTDGDIVVQVLRPSHSELVRGALSEVLAYGKDHKLVIDRVKSLVKDRIRDVQQSARKDVYSYIQKELSS